MTYEKLLKLFELVEARTDRKFEIGFEELIGCITLEFKGYCYEYFYATPLYEGTLGIPVQTPDEFHVESFVLPFSLSGDLELDAAEYVRVCNLIPEICGPTIESQKHPTLTTLRAADHAPENTGERECSWCSGYGKNKHGHCHACNGVGIIYGEEDR